MKTEIIVIDVKNNKERLRLYHYLNQNGYGFRERLEPLVLRQEPDISHPLIKLHLDLNEPKRVYRTSDRNKFISVDTFLNNGGILSTELDIIRKIIYED